MYFFLTGNELNNQYNDSRTKIFHVRLAYNITKDYFYAIIYILI